ncbi:hypothetical protein JHK87_043483 [Glycine soja]|nr:hypothetical protein JHK87_043483 [Glycine soja]
MTLEALMQAIQAIAIMERSKVVSQQEKENNNKLHRAREKSLYTELILDEEIKEGINSIMGSSIQEVSNEAVSKLSKINTKPLHVATEKKMKKKVATPAKHFTETLCPRPTTSFLLPPFPSIALLSHLKSG